MASPIRKVRLGAELEPLFVEALRTHATSPSELLRQSVRHALLPNTLAAETPEQRPSQEPGQPARAGAVRFTVRLPTWVLDEVHARARAFGTPASRWIAALVQSNVAAAPMLAERELLELEECARQLAAIGRNLNQIARALHLAPHDTERVRLDRLQYLDASIQRTRDAIQALVRASRNVWGITLR